MARPTSLTGRADPRRVPWQVVLSLGLRIAQEGRARWNRLTQREQRDMVRDVVREKKLDEAYANWVQEIRGRAYVEYRDPPQ